MKKVVLQAVGDICVNRTEPRSIFDKAIPVFKQGDIHFCQLETLFSERGSRNPAVRAALRTHPRNASALDAVPFDVVSFASNHAMDYCEEAFFDTIEIINKKERKIIGVGKNLAEARQPLIIERGGVKVGFLAYNSILSVGYMAQEYKPGCCPLRGLTAYEPMEYDQPGHPSKSHTFVHRGDLKMMTADIQQLRPQVDVIAVSLHAGLHFVRAELADYQIEAAHAAIDAGADLILGTHAHVLKAIEVYKGKVIFYSLGNFAFDRRRTKEEISRPGGFKDFMDAFKFTLSDEWLNSYAFPAESRKTLLARVVISNKKVTRVSFLPAMINKQAQPEFPAPGSEDFNSIVTYLEEVTREAGISTPFNIDGNEVVIVG